MGATLDPLRRRLYLEAMGIQVWRRRAGYPAGEGADARCADGQAEGPALADGQAGLAHLADPVALPGPGAEWLLAPEGSLIFPPVSTSVVATGLSEVPASALGWEELNGAVADCRACGLCETRIQTVFGVGRRDADLMLIGEAPGAEEDRRGEPFVGRAGQLLDRMLAAIGLGRDQVYIANILKCRPPGNRDPKPEEAAACRAFLLRQIALVQPRVLVSLGRISAQNLLETDEAVGRLRGRWFSFGSQALPLMVTYHPSYLLRSPEQKARAWQDLTQVARRLRGK